MGRSAAAPSVRQATCRWVSVSATHPKRTLPQREGKKRKCAHRRAVSAVLAFAIAPARSLVDRHDTRRHPQDDEVKKSPSISRRRETLLEKAARSHRRRPGSNPIKRGRNPTSSSPFAVPPPSSLLRKGRLHESPDQPRRPRQRRRHRPENRCAAFGRGGRGHRAVPRLPCGLPAQEADVSPASKSSATAGYHRGLPGQGMASYISPRCPAAARSAVLGFDKRPEATSGTPI